MKFPKRFKKFNKEKHTYDWAAKNGHLAVVKWLHENKIEGCSKRTMDLAAENGRLKIVKWLHENRNEGCTERIMEKAEQNGHVWVVKWLTENKITKGTDQPGECENFDVVNWVNEKLFDEDCFYFYPV
jgi:Tfp pilus assembly pilus retraction ATPase PilT